MIIPRRMLTTEESVAEAQKTDEVVNSVYQTAKDVVSPVVDAAMYFPSKLIGGIDKGVDMATGVSPLEYNERIGEGMQGMLLKGLSQGEPLQGFSEGYSGTPQDVKGSGSLFLDNLGSDLLDFLNPLDMVSGGASRFGRTPSDKNKNTVVGYASNLVKGQYGAPKSTKFNAYKTSPGAIESKMEAGEKLTASEKEIYKRYQTGVGAVHAAKTLQKVLPEKAVPGKLKRIADTDIEAKTQEGANPVLDVEAARTGLPKFFKEGIETVARSIFNPEDRAMLYDYGITTSSQKHIKDALTRKDGKKPSVRDVHQGVASLQHLGNMAARFDSDLNNMHSSVRDIIQEGLVDGFKPLTVDSFSESAGKVKRTKGDGTEYTVDSNLNRKLLLDGVGAWRAAGHKVDFDGSWLMAFKEPDHLTGKHVFDFRRGSKGLLKVDKFIKKNPQGFSSVEQLIETLGPNAKIRKIEDDGVIVNESFVGSAITEGGINASSKFKLDGTVDTVLTDVYDYFENSVGKPIEMMSSKKLLSVTSFSSDLKGRGSKGGDIINKSKELMPKAELEKKLKEVASLKANRKTVNREALVAGGRTAFFSDTEAEQEEQEEQE